MARVVNGAAAAVSATIFGNSLTLEFADGRKIVLNIHECPVAIREHAMMHGFKQKLVDAAAISRDPLTGKPATIETKYDAVREVFDRITSADGTWNKIRGDGTGSTGVGGLLYRALVRLYDGRQTPEQVRKYLDGLDAEQQAALRKNGKVAPMIATIKAEDAARRTETGEDDDPSDAMLADGLGPIPE
jgi:hypothetical protein